MKLVILDRDGVINQESADYIKSPEEWTPIAGSLEAIADLTKAGYTITVATNQSGVGRGMYDLAMLDRIHAKLLQAVTDHGGAIYKIYYCPHSPLDQCACRKPKPGMFEQMAHDLQIDISKIGATYIGDSLRDVVLGLNSNCQTFLVTSPDSHGRTTLKQLTPAQEQAITIVHDLAEATRRILA